MDASFPVGKEFEKFAEFSMIEVVVDRIGVVGIENLRYVDLNSVEQQPSIGLWLIDNWLEIDCCCAGAHSRAVSTLTSSEVSAI